MKRLSHPEIDKEVMELTVAEEKPTSVFAAHAAALKPQRQPIVNDWLNRPTSGGPRWNGPRAVLPKKV